MRTFLPILFIVFAPLVASAHAVPVETTPAASAVVLEMPKEISIRFSERIDAAASSITVKQGNEKISGIAHAGADARTLVAPLQDGSGLFSVTWSVVSKDDGHFTKGAYSFVVGSGAAPPPSDATAEVVQVTTIPEALAMTVELFGNGIMWAALLLFALAIRPALGSFSSHRRFIVNLYTGLVALAAGLVFSGGLSQILLKAGDLALLQEISLKAAIPIYLHTAAGSATLLRSAAVATLCLIFFFVRRKIVESERLTMDEIVLFGCMCVFAYFRAIISHATANPFHPHISIAFNFLHVIEKDLWAGLTFILLLICLMPRLRQFLSAILPRASKMLAFDAMAVAVTACYIVWLHLKSFHNLFTTQWGDAFLPLLFTATILMAFRSYHAVASAYRPKLFGYLMPISFAAEFALALLVVYFSSVVIITSPPLTGGNEIVRSASDQGVTVSLEKDVSDDSSVLISLTGGSPKMPSVSIGSQVVVLSQRFEGGYSFPKALLGDSEAKLDIAVPQSGAYDAHASFTVRQLDFAQSEEGRTFDPFSKAMLAIVAAAFIYTLLLYWISGRPQHLAPSIKAPLFLAVVVFFVVSFGVASASYAFGKSPLSNPYKAECESDGNMWHLMVPSRAGESRAHTPQEGCMWGMGAYVYHFPDRREYEYLKSFPQADVSLATAPEKLTAGVPSKLTISLKEPDGSPAKLFVDMEKLIHVVVISEDETVFAHIHPDDVHPIPQHDIDTSTYAVDYTFPKAGKYIIAADYAHGLTLESKQFVVDVSGSQKQGEIRKYGQEGDFGGYHVQLKFASAYAGEPVTLQYVFSKDGKPFSDIQSYLSAAMHISVVKNDFSAFAHAHGEVHPPGTPLPPITVRDGKIIHSMQSMMYQPPYGPNIEAHVLFPTPGLYTVWGQFKAGGVVIPTVFTVNVED